MPLLTIDDFEELEFPISARMSPNGESIAVTVAPMVRTGDQTRAAIWVVPTDGSRPERKFTNGLASDLQPSWSPDGATLYFLSDRARPGKHELYSLPIDGGEAERMISKDAGINYYEVHPDGERIVILAENLHDDETPKSGDKKNDVRINNAIRKPSRLAVITIGDDDFAPLASPPDRHIATFSISPDGKSLAVVTWPVAELNSSLVDTKLHIVDLERDEVVREWDAPTDAGHPVWSPESDRIWYIGHHKRPWRGGYAIYSLSLQEKKPKKSTPVLAACPFQIEVAPAGDPHVLFASGLDTAMARVSPDLESIEFVGEMRGAAYGLSTSSDSKSIALVMSSGNALPEVWAGSPDGGIEQRTEFNPDFDEIEWGEQERLEWLSPDGLLIDGLLVRPAGESAEAPYPLITLAHGGPYSRWTDSLSLSWAPSAQWLAAAGYAVFMPNPRGGMGHGSMFADTVSGKVGLDDWRDIETGLDLLIERGIADPDRLGIAGWSQGGFMTAWAVGQTDRFKAGVMGAGVSDWGMMVAESDIYRCEGDLGGSFGWERTQPNRHAKVSPITYAHRVKTPVLILHGANDSRVPATQAQYFYRALRHHDVPCELAVYPREGHRINEWAHVRDLLIRTRDWFDRWLLDAPGGKGATNDAAG